MTVSVAVVCEAPADRDTVTALAGRVIREAAGWITPDVLAEYVEWRGYRRAEPHLEWTALRTHAEALNLRIRFRDTHPIHPYALNALRAIRVLARASERERVDAVILVPDSDNDLDRLKGLRQARDYAQGALPVAVGLPHTKRECWHLCGFEPEDDGEAEAVTRLRAELGFDPRTGSELLTAKHDAANDKRSAKRVLAALTGGNPDREARCLTALPLAELEARGRGNGLADFLAELRTHIVPLFAPPAPPG